MEKDAELPWLGKIVGSCKIFLKVILKITTKVKCLRCVCLQSLYTVHLLGLLLLNYKEKWELLKTQ